MNILDELYFNRITEDEAYTFIDLTMDRVNGDANKSNSVDEKIDLAAILLMDEYEYTAYCQGAPLSVIANWRHKGWPQSYCNTKEPIDYKKYHWFVVEFEPDIWGLKKI